MGPTLPNKTFTSKPGADQKVPEGGEREEWVFVVIVQKASGKGRRWSVSVGCRGRAEWGGGELKL